MQLAEAGAQEHHPVSVVDPPVVGDDVRCRAPVLGDEDRLRTPDGLHLSRRPVHDLGVEDVPGGLHPRMRCADRDVAVTRWLGGRLDVPPWPIDVDADEVERCGDRREFLVGERRRPAASCGKVGVGVATLQDHRHEPGVALARRRSPRRARSPERR